MERTHPRHSECVRRKRVDVRSRDAHATMTGHSTPTRSPCVRGMPNNSCRPQSAAARHQQMSATNCLRLLSASRRKLSPTRHVDCSYRRQRAQCAHQTFSLTSVQRFRVRFTQRKRICLQIAAIINTHNERRRTCHSKY